MNYSTSQILSIFIENMMKPVKTAGNFLCVKYLHSFFVPQKLETPSVKKPINVCCKVNQIARNKFSKEYCFTQAVSYTSKKIFF